MSDLATAESCGEEISGWWHSRTMTKVLLGGGMAAAGIYALGNVISGLLYDGYSFRDQAISELSAFGSPVRPLMVTVILISNMLVVGLAVGLWRSTDRKSLRGAAALLLAAGLAGLPNHTVWAMSSRWMEGGLNDTMHQITSSVWVVLVFVGAPSPTEDGSGSTRSSQWWRLWGSEQLQGSPSWASRRTTRRGRAVLN